MTIRHGTTVLILGIVLALVAGPALAQTTAPHDHAAPPALDRPDFNAQIDVAVLGQLAVHRDGRVKTFESFAREMMGYVCGPRPYRGQPSVVTYLDFMFRPEAYAEADVIFVKSKLIRARIAEALTASIREQMETMGLGPVMVAELNRQVEAFRDTGRISVPMLQDAKVQALLARLETDLLRTAKFVRAIETATAVQDAGVLRRNLRIVPPPVGGFDDAWLTPEEFAAMMAGDPAARERVSGAWASLRTGWIEGDAAAVNAAGAELAAALPPLNPELYPDSGRLSWESWYFRMRNMTWVWVIYALSLIPLVLYTVFRWTGARWFGLLLFMAAFGLHTFAVGLRWYVAERFPNTNMFEAVTTAAWFGGCFALILEIALRKSPVRGLFALGSAASSMVALMAAHFLPVELNAGIGNRMPVLHDVWLYIHTNVIIFSYCLIFMASISAILYLFYRAGRALSGRGGDHGADDFARVGGAGSLIMTTPDGGSYLTRAKTTLGQVLDGTTMIVLELSFIMLWAGLVMGAIWADHSWGRPWGWDPKEVFALNTFIIFALLIHTRLKVRDKGLWTAILAIVGCGVMLFNWIVINFTISGLHSYA